MVVAPVEVVVGFVVVVVPVAPVVLVVAGAVVVLVVAGAVVAVVEPLLDDDVTGVVAAVVEVVVLAVVEVGLLVAVDDAVVPLRTAVVEERGTVSEAISSPRPTAASEAAAPNSAVRRRTRTIAPVRAACRTLLRLR